MPYIDKDQRPFFDLPDDGFGSAANPGQLNFQITRLVDQYIADSGGLNYGNINEAIGVLECAKLELYRRLAGPYEDRKIVENGDVYTVLP